MSELGILNFNLGILGHVDSGKTSLAKALSSVASTACFDKNPQSKARGITLDLGFSSLTVTIPEHLKQDLSDKCKTLQFTLVDCPGHASLIKTIIGGAQIIDMMLLVIDISKGIQTQTAECIVIGEITCDKMIVVLNKIDLVPPEKLKSSIDKMMKKIHLALKSTKFQNCAFVPVSACQDSENPVHASDGISDLVKLLTKSAFVPKRETSGKFLFSIDHCFPIKGQGTIMTGTVISGRVSINDSIEIPALKLNRKIKSIQMFRQSVDHACQGDRIGICVTQFDSKLLERGLACTPGLLLTAYGLLINLEKIPYFKQTIKDRTKFHITLGHETIMARLHLFQSKESELSFDIEYEHCNEISVDTDKFHFALLELDHSLPVVPGGLVIGSKLDTDIQSNSCRIAFKGTIKHIFVDENYMKDKLPALKVFKIKQKDGIVERMSSPFEVIVKNMIRKETSVLPFINLQVLLSSGETGFIEGHFGQSGKLKIRLKDGLKSETQSILKHLSKKKSTDTFVGDYAQIKVQLMFKRYIYDPQKKLIQTDIQENLGLK